MHSARIATVTLSLLFAIAACGGTGGTDEDTGGGDAGAGGSGTAGKAGGAGGAGGAKAGGAGTAGGSGASSGKGGSSGSAGAAGTGASGASSGTAGASGSSSSCAQGTILCDGKTKKVCDGKGGFSETTLCPTECAPDLGCVTCVPGTGKCEGSAPVKCKMDGSGYEPPGAPCDPDLGLTCEPKTGTCSGACSTSALQRSYIGCEYFPTVTANSLLNDAFHFAIAIANTTTSPADVKVLKGGAMVASVMVPPGGLSTVNLPWVPELKAASTALVTKAAYHVKSTQPVTVTQFNPLEFELSVDCGDPLGGATCRAYTNDASLLLPRNSLGTSYFVASSGALAERETFFGSVTVSAIPGMMAVTAVEDGTMVTVKSAANVAPGSGVGALSAGQTGTYALNAGDVLQLTTATPGKGDLTGCKAQGGGTDWCGVTKAFDLTGSEVTSTKPVMVIGGHNCTRMPYGDAACDHNEEIMFPTSALGKEVIVTAPQTLSGAKSNDGMPEKHVVRVISAVDGNQVTLDPLPPGASSGTLNRGQYADVPVSNLDFVVKGTGPLLVSQWMVSADSALPGSAGSSDSIGDPSLSLGIPSAQYRSDYVFLAPDSYTYNFVNVVYQDGTDVQIDGKPLSGPAPKKIGSSGWTVARVKVAGGTHTAKGAKPFGIVVYGYGLYTSYMVPGGLDLNAL